MRIVFIFTFLVVYFQVVEVVTDLKDLTYQLRRNQRGKSQVEVAAQFYNCGQSTTELNSQFVNFLLLIDVFTRMESHPEDKCLFVDYCRRNFRKKMDLKFIDKFELDYSFKTAIHWYTRETFLYRLLNEALRKSNIEVLLLMRFFIADIYRQLQIKDTEIPSDGKLYRAQLMYDEEFKRLQSLKGQLISVKSFFSTSSAGPDSVRRFLKDDSDSPPVRHRVLFIIIADPRVISSTPYADVSKRSSIPEESEVLFMVGSIFRLNSIRQVHDNGPLWEVHMSLCGDDENNLKPFFERIKKGYGGGNGAATSLTLADVLREMQEYDLAIDIYKKISSNRRSNDPSIPGLYKSLGIAHKDKGDYEKSYQYFDKALLAYKRAGEKRDYEVIADLKIWIAETNRAQGKNDMALTEYGEIIELFRQEHDEENDLLAHVYNNSGIIYKEMGKYNEALQCHEKALKIRRKVLPANFPHIAASYNNMGNIYTLLKTYDRSLDSHLHALEIRKKCFPPEHIEIGHSYRNIGQVYHTLSDWKAAMDFYRQAEPIYEHSLSAEDPFMIDLQNEMTSVQSEME